MAQFLFEKGVRHGFGIIGSANSHLFDSLFQMQPKFELVCNHHEQACVMAVQTYWKVTGTPSIALVTAGAGSSNAITGVLSAWADSIPCLVLSGQENSRFFTPDHRLRMYGIQGYDSPLAVSKMTKYAARIMDPTQVLVEMEKAWQIATSGRPGPCWLDFPMNVQAASVEENELPTYQDKLPFKEKESFADLHQRIRQVLGHIEKAERPLLWLGVGVAMAGARTEALALVDRLGIPVLLSWSAADLLTSDHPLMAGRAGTYGQRAANLILQNCDYLLAIGTRLAIPQIGYEIGEFARGAKNITVVDIDPAELTKYPNRLNEPICADAGDFIRHLAKLFSSEPNPQHDSWRRRCREIRKSYPVIGPEHADRGGYINSYRFMEKLRPHLKVDQIIVTDMGTALLSGHQALSLNPPQRLITSQGLGEMGFGLPGAIGASFATNRGEVLCLNCDGGMMMNLQELQTIAHHRLPIKIVVFNNDGYLMIKHTQKAILEGRYSGTDTQSGVSCPDFAKVASAFELPSWKVRTWEDFDHHIPAMQNQKGPCLLEVFMDPEQPFHPKLSLAVSANGALISPPLEDLSPLLSRDILKKEMGDLFHAKCKNLTT